MGGYFNFLGSLLLQVESLYYNCDKTTWSIFKILMPSDSSVSSSSNCGVWRFYLYSKVTFNPLAATMYQYVMFLSLYYIYTYAVSLLYSVLLLMQLCE